MKQEELQQKKEYRQKVAALIEEKEIPKLISKVDIKRL